MKDAIAEQYVRMLNNEINNVLKNFLPKKCFNKLSNCNNPIIGRKILQEYGYTISIYSFQNQFEYTLSSCLNNRKICSVIASFPDITVHLYAPDIKPIKVNEIQNRHKHIGNKKI